MVLMMWRGLFPLSVLSVLSCFTYLFGVEEATLVDRAACLSGHPGDRVYRSDLQLQIGK